MSRPPSILLPYGILDLDPVVMIDPGPPLRIKCFVEACNQFLIPPTRERRGEVCPVHGIRCTRSGTYIYSDVRQNIIVSQDLLADRIVGHPFKVETWRFGNERGEDALTFNVFRSFQLVQCLNYIGRYITGLPIEEEPTLYLWGLNLSDDSLIPSPLLLAARERFEKRLPVRRPKTEPDVILHLPGEYLILIEAKFCSPNTFYLDGPRRNLQSLTKAELLDIYSDLSLQYLDRGKAIAADRVYYQLWRNVTFAEWMAQLDSPRTKAFFANLTRRGYENQSFYHFQEMVRPVSIPRVVHLFWEDLYVLAGLAGGRLTLLQEYLLTKTANLLSAFDFRYW